MIKQTSKLERFSGNYSQALEGDVNLRYYGSPSQKDEAVMNNPPEQIADVTLEQWLYAVIPSLRVIKLDLTIDEVVPIVLESLRYLDYRIYFL